MKKINWWIVFWLTSLVFISVFVDTLLFFTKCRAQVPLPSPDTGDVSISPMIDPLVDVVPAPARHASSGCLLPNYRILKLGDTGEDVKIFQKLVGAKVDGVFGEETWAKWNVYKLNLK